jgi:hypothetical protein
MKGRIDERQERLMEEETEWVRPFESRAGIVQGKEKSISDEEIARNG